MFYPIGLVGVDSAGGESWTRKEAEEESGNRSEMAEMRSEVRRHVIERRKLERGQRHLFGINDNFTAGGKSSTRKEAVEEEGNDLFKQPGESEDSYMKRLRVPTVQKRGKVAERPASGLTTEAMVPARRLGRDKNQPEAKSKEKHRMKPKVEVKEAEAGEAKPPVSDAGKPEESVREDGKAEEYVTVGSGTSAMNQEALGLSSTDNEDILQQVFRYKLDRDGNFIPDKAKEKERREMLKAIQDRMERTRKSLFHWLPKLPTKDEESGKAEAPVTVPGKPKESAMDQVVISDNKESLEQVRKVKLDMLDVEEDSNRTNEPAADPNPVTIQDDHVDKGKSALAKKTADEEAKDYASFRSYWESKCCNDCDHFEQMTMLGPMLYTHCTPGIVPYIVAETLEIFSMKLKLRDNNPGGFELPLSVYGMVAVRDTLDSRRNILFSCGGSTEPQELTQDDPFLLLTGPSRAIMSADNVDFEIYLKVKDAAASQVKPLMTCVRSYAGGSGTALCFDNVLCTLEVCLRTVKDAVQATILGVQIVKKKELCPANFTYGGQVVCTPLPRTDSAGNQKIVLIKSKGRKMWQGDAGYVHLWRQVVSVPVGGALRLVIQSYGKYGGVAAEGHVDFRAQNCHVSQQQCIVGQTQVNVTVAWSVVPTDIDNVVYCSG